MTWTATLKDIAQLETCLGVVVEYSDGEKVFVREYHLGTVSDEIIKGIIYNEISRLENSDPAAVTLSVGDKFTSADVVSQPAVAAEKISAFPDPKQEFFNGYSRLVSMKRGIDAGIIAPDYAPFLALQKQLSGQFNEAWADDL